MLYQGNHIPVIETTVAYHLLHFAYSCNFFVMCLHVYDLVKSEPFNVAINKFTIIFINTIIIPLHWLTNLVLFYSIVCSFIFDTHNYLCILNTEDSRKTWGTPIIVDEVSFLLRNHAPPKRRLPFTSQMISQYSKLQRGPISAWVFMIYQAMVFVVRSWESAVKTVKEKNHPIKNVRLFLRPKHIPQKAALLIVLQNHLYSYLN
jgi:hypothetical protein